jgi:acylglycerol lipase
MQQVPFTLKNPADGFQFFAQAWKPPEIGRVLVVQHGFGEHSGRYKNLIQALEDTGTAIYALDSRGHGKTPGRRGHVDDFNLYASDLTVLIKTARAENKSQPLFLLGHSMGALIAGLAVLQGSASELTGVVFSSGGFRPALDPVQDIKKTVGTFLANFAPAVTVDAGLDARLISRDEQTVLAYKNDPLVHGKISLKMGADLFATGEQLLRSASRITLPALVLHGDADGIARSDGSREFFGALSSKDKTLKIYPGFYHETMNEPHTDRQHVLADIRDWLLAHS